MIDSLTELTFSQTVIRCHCSVMLLAGLPSAQSTRLPFVDVQHDECWNGRRGTAIQMPSGLCVVCNGLQLSAVCSFQM